MRWSGGVAWVRIGSSSSRSLAANAVVHWAWNKENHGCCGASCLLRAGGAATTA
jgi:hypothetical protein